MKGRAYLKNGPMDGKDLVVPSLDKELVFSLMQPVKAFEAEENPSLQIQIGSATYRRWKVLSDGAVYHYVTPPE